MKVASLIIIVLISSFWQKKDPKVNPVPTSLKGTNWTSHFYHYHNNYFFDSDSTGFSEDGQMKWSLPIDTIASGNSGDSIIYDDPKKFKYNIVDTILTIEYLTWKPNNIAENRVFVYRSKSADWISEYEYAYGKECLKQAERAEEYKLE